MSNQASNSANDCGYSSAAGHTTGWGYLSQVNTPHQAFENERLNVEKPGLMLSGLTVFGVPHPTVIINANLSMADWGVTLIHELLHVAYSVSERSHSEIWSKLGLVTFSIGLSQVQPLSKTPTNWVIRNLVWRGGIVSAESVAKFLAAQDSGGQSLVVLRIFDEADTIRRFPDLLMSFTIYPYRDQRKEAYDQLIRAAHARRDEPLAEHIRLGDQLTLRFRSDVFGNTIGASPKLRSDTALAELVECTSKPHSEYPKLDEDEILVCFLRTSRVDESTATAIHNKLQSIVVRDSSKRTFDPTPGLPG